MTLRLFLTIAVVVNLSSVLVHSDYNRNIARSAYWLLINNLFHVNMTEQRRFYSIVDDPQLTKKEILLKLGKWVENKGSYMVRQYERMINYEKQLYKTFEEFQLELVHSEDANKLIQKLYQEHKSLDTTWKQTCRHKNQLIRLADKAVKNELKLQLNSWCIPKAKPKKSGLLSNSQNASKTTQKSPQVAETWTTMPPVTKEENRTAILIQALDFLGGLGGEDLEKIRNGGKTTATTVAPVTKEENRTVMLIQALDFLGGMGGEDLSKIKNEK